MEKCKRAIDITFVFLIGPLALLVAGVFAMAIRAESRGNPVFRQVRVGRNGRAFNIFKLRTMVDNAENIGAGLYAEKDDPRFTKVGSLARRLSVDELPQLLNILCGDMSVVGPRPMVRAIVEQYAADYEVILGVKPGLTGLVQVSGRNALPRSRRIELDKEYASTWTLGHDLRIILKTAWIVLSGSGQENQGLRKDVER
jgi:lipopolysaccharide/colanic/teichoic acid biosynthesis glycosyltransferase